MLTSQHCYHLIISTAKCDGLFCHIADRQSIHELCSYTTECHYGIIVSQSIIDSYSKDVYRHNYDNRIYSASRAADTEKAKGLRVTNWGVCKAVRLYPLGIWLQALSHIFFKFHRGKLQTSAGFQLLQHINCNMWNYPASSCQFCTSVMNRCGDKWGGGQNAPKTPRGLCTACKCCGH